MGVVLLKFKMTRICIVTFVLSVQLFVFKQSTCMAAEAQQSTMVTFEGPKENLKTTELNIDRTVTITKLIVNHSESSETNSGWTPSTKSHTESSQHYSGWTPSTITILPMRYSGITTEWTTHENRSSNATSVSPEHVEELLNSTETREFLNSIENEVKRIVITEQLRNCPYSDLCTFSFNLTLPKFNVSACANCSCTQNSKFSLCPDVLDFSSFGVIPSEPFDCFSMYLKPLKDEPLNSEKPKYKTIYKCASQNTGTESDSCIPMKKDKTFNDIIPVTDRFTNVTYINAEYAVCNDVDEDNLVFWDVEMACEEREVQVYRSDSELINFYENKSSCNMKYVIKKSDSVKPETCPYVIRKCNETGDWKIFDPFMFSACAFYENRYSIEVKVGTPRFIYRNIFCALCNGVDPSIYTVFEYEKRWLSPSHIYSFSGLISFSQWKHSELVTEQKTACESGQIFDVVKSQCVQLLCAPLRRLEDGTCKPIYNEIAGVVYIFTARLYPTEFQQIVIKGLIYEPFEQFFRSVFFKDFIIKKDDYTLYTSICYRGFKVITSAVCENTGFLSVACSLKVDYYELELHFAITQFHSLSEIIDRYRNMTRSQPILVVTTGGMTFNFTIKPQQLHASLPDRSDPDDGICPPSAETIILAHQASCPLVALSSNDYKWVEEDDSIFFNSTHEVLLNKSQAIFNSNRTSIRICSDLYSNHFHSKSSKSPDLEENENLSVEAVISLVCVSMSIVSLLVSFVTFSAYSSLRTLPGKNNMALIMCLLCAQTLFLVGSFSRFEQRSVICIIIGILTHFFWLMSVCWMNVCTIHVFRVFIGMGDYATGRGHRTFSVYWLYTIVLSVTFVLINVCLSLSKSDYSELGYGKLTCYINSQKMVGFTFGVPVGCVIITNMILFCSVIRKIIKMPKIQKDVRHERSDIVIFAKLSSLTGFCWIFGFVYSWTGILAFSYLFIVLNASQGIFIFLSFVCTKRVIKMYKDNISAIMTRGTSLRTKSTDSRLNGQKYISHPTT